MGSRRPSINSQSALPNFETLLKDYTVNPEADEDGNKGKPFIRGQALTEWLGSLAPLKNQATNAALLLDKCFPDENQLLPIKENDILRGDKKCPLMFCILLEIGCGEHIGTFHNIGLHDGLLPMEIQDLRKHLLQARPHFDQAAIRAFGERQWAYFPQVLSYKMRPLPLSTKMRLPILRQSKIGTGGTAKVYKIVVPEEFVTRDLVKLVSHSNTHHEKYGLCYVFALKTFLDKSQAMCDAEIGAYRHLQDNKHVIRCLGGFNHYAVDGHDKVHSILLEYGQCDLAEYFNAVNPPALPEDVELFWAELFNIVKAVRDIHNYTAPRAGKEESYDGWHGDIKPQNILMTKQVLEASDSPLAGKRFKMADPGFVNFRRREKSRTTPRMLNGWTSTYGPPEVNENRPSVAEPWAVDIWSTGCVLSEAATWIVLSQSGRAAYLAARQVATKRLSHKSTYLQLEPSVELGIGDFFHDGQKVLETVLSWHEFLRAMIRPNDAVTGAVLQLIDDELLVQNPIARIRADKLCSRLDKIIQDAHRKRENDYTPAEFKSFVRVTRRQALEKWISLSEVHDGMSVEDRKAQDTAATSAIFNFIHTTEKNKRSHVNPIDSLGRLNTGNSDRDDPFQAPRTPPKATATFSGQPRHSNDNSSSSEPIKTVFDSYYAEKPTGIVGRLTKSNKKTKDEQLTTHYENRDIVYLVDNAGSMAKYWSEVKFTLNELVRTSRNQDDDGIDLMFTGSSKTVEHAKRDAEGQFAKVMESNEVQPQAGVLTDISKKLCQQLYSWLDGQWSSVDEYEIDNELVKFGRAVKNTTGFSSDQRPVSIQFVSFGRDPVALGRLQRLDDTLKSHGVEDIIDTEPSYGDLYKMLLGSLDPERDESNTVQSPHASPPILNASSSQYSWTGTPNSSDPSSGLLHITPRSSRNNLLNAPSQQQLPRAQGIDSGRHERSFGQGGKRRH